MGWNTKVHPIGWELQLEHSDSDCESAVRYLAFNIGLSLYRRGWDKERVLKVMRQELLRGIADEHSIQETGDDSAWAWRWEDAA